MTTTTFFQILPTAVSLAVLIGGFIFAFGRIKEKMMTKEQFKKDCSANQSKCSIGLGKKVDDLKELVVRLHNEQTNKIEAMDDKREQAKEQNHAEMLKINKTIGKIEGHLEILRNGSR